MPRIFTKQELLDYVIPIYSHRPNWKQDIQDLDRLPNDSELIFVPEKEYESYKPEYRYITCLFDGFSWGVVMKRWTPTTFIDLVPAND